MHGKDITIPKGTEITAYVNGDFPLDLVKLKTASALTSGTVQMARLGDSGTTQSIMVINPSGNIAVPEVTPRSEPQPVERTSTLPANKESSILSINRLFVDSFGDDSISKSLHGWIVNALSDSSRIIVTESHDRADGVLKRDVLDNTNVFRLITRDGDVVWSITQQPSSNPQETANTVASKLLSVLSPPPPPPAVPTTFTEPPPASTSTPASVSTPAAPMAALASGTYEGTATNRSFGKSAKMHFQLVEVNGTIFGCSIVEKPLAGWGQLRGTHAGSTVILDHDDKKMLIQFTGTLMGDELKGTFSVQPSKDIGEFTLKRVSPDAPLASNSALCSQK